MDACFYAIGDFFTYIFEHVVETLNYTPSKIVIAVIAVGIVYWVSYLMKNPQGKDNYLAEK